MFDSLLISDLFVCCRYCEVFGCGLEAVVKRYTATYTAPNATTQPNKNSGKHIRRPLYTTIAMFHLPTIPLSHT